MLSYIWALIINRVPVSNVHCRHFVFLQILPPDYYGIFVKLINVSIPLCVLNTFINWYGKWYANFRWAGVFSQQFGVRSGVREGNIILPLIFSLYINDLVSLLKSEGYDCYLGNVYVGCLLFADDIMLLSASMRQLQCMFNVCYQYCFKWNLKFNVKKSTVMVISKHDAVQLPEMSLGTGVLHWVQETKYLGTFLLLHKGLRVNVDSNCRKILSASFCILQRFGHLSEPVLREIILTNVNLFCCMVSSVLCC